MAASAPLILLTGATGFVGRQVLRALGDALQRTTDRQDGQTGAPRARRCDRNGRSHCGLVVRERRMVCRCLPRRRRGDPRRLVCRTGSVSSIAEESECLAGTLRLSQGASQAKVRRFVGIGTCFEYDLERRLSDRCRRRCGRRRPTPRRRPLPSWRCRNICRNRGSSLPGAGCSTSMARARTHAGWCRICAPGSGWRACRSEQRQPDSRLPGCARGRANDRGARARLADKDRSISAPARP